VPAFYSTLGRLCLALAGIVTALPGVGVAQTNCSSDGQLAPVALLERFTHADCATCWSDPATARPAARELAIDWIVPSPKGDEAALSAAASRDALQRLEALKQTLSSGTLKHRSPSDRVAQSTTRAPLKLRVAHGVALGGYMGASVELTIARKAPLLSRANAYPLTAWLVLAEDIAVGVEGSPVARLLVRNALVTSWPKGQRTFESRPMSLSAGSNPDKLRVVGWVEDAQGQVIARAASHCR
jgi:hypothetical protein